MYYIVKGPCCLCEALCKGLSESCTCLKGICGGFRNLCDDTFGMVYRKPTGGYVMFTILLMLVAIALAITAYLEMKCSSELTNAKNALLVVVAFGIIHCGCVIWIQKQIVADIDKQIEEQGEAQTIGKPGGVDDQTDKKVVERNNYDDYAKVRDAIWTIIKFDFVFLFYFLFCPASFAMGCYGMSLVDACSKNSWAASWAFGALIFYNCCCGLYFLGILCKVGCGKGKERVKKKIPAKGTSA